MGLSFVLAALSFFTSPLLVSGVAMPVVQNSHRISIQGSVNSVAFSFATYVAPNTYNDTSFKPKQGHVWVHGQGRNGDEMVNTYKNSIGPAVAAGYVAQASDVVVLSIVLPNSDDEAKSLFPSVLTWEGNSWMEGADANEAAISSFNVIRSAFDWLASTYPTITTFALGGHSAVVNPTDSSPNRYIIANPSSVAYFTNERPNCNTTSTCSSCVAPGYESQCCSKFNDWKTGLDNYPYRYQKSAMTASDKAPVINRYIARKIHYLYGSADNGGTTNGCAANAQGIGHFDRGQKWWDYLTRNWAAVKNTQTKDNIDGVAHDSSGIWTSPKGLQRVYSSS
ncbi:hypothetical protein BKA62DRAFT_713441 [Auriculariales sp. MPI-PUGE-AT-0066]|nr:hypothetical protein BKA62DRAFT_713441 [Auriculariales sp. MPI-PUGE-AT-0066]